MDESTLHIDTETEESIKKALRVVSKNHTVIVIVIAHRLLTIYGADKVIVLNPRAQGRGRDACRVACLKRRLRQHLPRPGREYRRNTSGCGNETIINKSNIKGLNLQVQSLFYLEKAVSHGTCYRPISYGPLY